MKYINKNVTKRTKGKNIIHYHHIHYLMYLIYSIEDYVLHSLLINVNNTLVSLFTLNKPWRIFGSYA